MREFLLYGVVTPFVFWWAYKGFGIALALYRHDRKERLALALAREGGPFSVAYTTVKSLGGKIPSCPPWCRPETGGQG